MPLRKERVSCIHLLQEDMLRHLAANASTTCLLREVGQQHQGSACRHHNCGVAVITGCVSLWQEAPKRRAKNPMADRMAHPILRILKLIAHLRQKVLLSIFFKKHSH